MDLTGSYCQTRRSLESRSWKLTSHLADLTAGLISLAGRDRKSFIDLLNECRASKMEVAASHGDLQKHRHEHGC